MRNFHQASSILPFGAMVLKKINLGLEHVFTKYLNFLFAVLQDQKTVLQDFNSWIFENPVHAVLNERVVLPVRNSCRRFPPSS